MCVHSSLLFYFLLQDQYVFVNDAVLESVTCGNTQVDSRNARIVFNKMSTPDPRTGQTGYDDQFTVSYRLRL